MSVQKSSLKRPQLTLPPAAAELVRAEYARAKVILEYGSGGSTVMAGEVPGATVFSVESDKDWVAMMRTWFEENPPAGKVHLHHVDIGPTREWGYPKGSASWHRFIDYPLEVWDRTDFPDPDVVLIDGRFRVGCFIATLLRTKLPTTILFDDYFDRPAYHVVERFFPVAAKVDRLARFEVKPVDLDVRDLREIYSLMTEVF